MLVLWHWNNSHILLWNEDVHVVAFLWRITKPCAIAGQTQHRRDLCGDAFHGDKVGLELFLDPFPASPALMSKAPARKTACPVRAFLSSMLLLITIVRKVSSMRPRFSHRAAKQARGVRHLEAIALHT